MSPPEELRYPKPVTVSVTVPVGRDEVYDFLDVLANHEPFTDHLLVDWSYSGPERGVGARARMRLKKPGRVDWMDLEVIGADPPRRSTEETVGARGRRRTRGTYLLTELATGETRISFEFAWLRLPLIERLATPITRSVVRRGNLRSLQRLAEQLRWRSLARAALHC
jgi:Polyketide cyclase / dehydrase and lipid transport